MRKQSTNQRLVLTLVVVVASTSVCDFATSEHAPWISLGATSFIPLAPADAFCATSQSRVLIRKWSPYSPYKNSNANKHKYYNNSNSSRQLRLTLQKSSSQTQKHSKRSWVWNGRDACSTMPFVSCPRPFSASPLSLSQDEDEVLRVIDFDETSSHQRLRGILVLLTVPFAWGTYAPVVKFVYEMDPPTPGFVFSAAYYAIASSTLILLSTIVPYLGSSGTVAAVSSENGKPDSLSRISPRILGGVELGSYLFMGNCLQVVGLESTPADRAAFLVQLTTIMVPLLQAFLARNFTLIPITTWGACLLAFVGVIVMGLDRPDVDVSSLWNSVDGMMLGFSFSAGDVLIILAAFCYSMHVLRLSKYAEQIAPLELAASKATVETVLSIGLVLGLLSVQPSSMMGVPFLDGESREIQKYFSELQSAMDRGTFPPTGFLNAFLASLWTGLVTCAYTIYAQSYGQRRVGPTDANLIYTMQPVFSSFFAWALLGENLGVYGYVGALLIGLALWVVSSDR